MTLQELLTLAHEIEKNWSHMPLRQKLLEQFIIEFNKKTDPFIYEKTAHLLERFIRTPNKELNKNSCHELNQNSDLKHFLNILVPLERHLKKTLQDDEFVILEKDGSRQVEREKYPICIVLDHIRSAFNVGSIFRTAECFGASEIILVGYTPTPEDLKTKKTTMGTDEYVKWSHVQHLAEAIKNLKAQGFFVYAVETAEKAKPIYAVQFQKPSAFIFGNERFGLSHDVFTQVDQVIQIPLAGWKNSLNVGVSVGVVLSEVSRQWS